MGWRDYTAYSYLRAAESACSVTPLINAMDELERRAILEELHDLRRALDVPAISDMESDYLVSRARRLYLQASALVPF